MLGGILPGSLAVRLSLVLIRHACTECYADK